MGSSRLFANLLASEKNPSPYLRILNSPQLESSKRPLSSTSLGATPTLPAQINVDGHHQRFPIRVDGRIGHLHGLHQSHGLRQHNRDGFRSRVFWGGSKDQHLSKNRLKAADSRRFRGSLSLKKQSVQVSCVR